MFKQQEHELAGEYRVLSWDCRGHGASRPNRVPFSLGVLTEDLLALLAAEKLRNVVLVGQSMGGVVAQRAAIRAPERVRALVLLDAPPVFRRLERVERLALRLAALAISVLPRPYLGWWMGRIAVATGDTRRYIAEMASALSKHEMRAAWSGMTSDLEVPFRSAKSVPGSADTIPTLVVYGRHDLPSRILGKDGYWRKLRPDALVSHVRRAGHNANQDNPRAVNRLLRSFIESLELEYQRGKSRSPARKRRVSSRDARAVSLSFLS
jgi:pimeloyl-ACP methyl ester carboxylesterase